jgi:acyl-coenzyme A thioesterase PaaI-like protein
MSADLLTCLPYAAFLGLTGEETDRGVRVTMPFTDGLIGNPMLPALHGGSTAALLEMTAIVQVASTFPRLRLPKPINVTVCYLRTGRPKDTHALARIRRAGRRIAHVTVDAWQGDSADPIATLTAHFLLQDEHTQ